MTQRDRTFIVTNIFSAATLVAADAIVPLAILAVVWMVLLLAAEFTDR